MALGLSEFCRCLGDLAGRLARDFLTLSRRWPLFAGGPRCLLGGLLQLLACGLSLLCGGLLSALIQRLARRLHRFAGRLRGFVRLFGVVPRFAQVEGLLRQSFGRLFEGLRQSFRSPIQLPLALFLRSLPGCGGFGEPREFLGKRLLPVRQFAGFLRGRRIGLSRLARGLTRLLALLSRLLQIARLSRLRRGLRLLREFFQR